MCCQSKIPRKIVSLSPSLGQLLDAKKVDIFNILHAEIDETDVSRVKTVSLACVCEFTNEIGSFTVIHCCQPYFLEPDIDILYNYLKEDLLDLHYEYLIDNPDHKFASLIRCNVRFFSTQEIE